MTVDISQFYQIFFEEAAEHLATMESLLLTLDVADPDIESLHAIFRAAHSIKGGAGTFGFNDMTESTHIMESLLDRLRTQELTLVTEMVDTLLDSVDLLRQQLAKHQGSGDAVDPAMLKDNCIRLQKFISASEEAEETTSSKAKKASKTFLSEDFASLKDQVYTIRFIHVPKEVSWDGLEAEIARMGSVECVFQENEERVCVLVTSASLNDLHESLGFVLKPEHYSVEEGRQTCPTMAKEDSAFGFFDEGFAVPEALSNPKEIEYAHDFISSSLEEYENILLDEIEGALIEVAKARQSNPENGDSVLDEVERELLAAGIAASTFPCANSEKNARLGYGFFKENPGAPLEAENPSIQNTDHGQSYGFFEDSPGSPDQTVEPEFITPAKSLSLGHVIVDEVPPAKKIKQEETVVAANEIRGRRQGDPVSGEAQMGRRASDKVATPAADSSSIRVSVEKVDQMLNLVGELVITQSMLMQVAGQMEPDVCEQLSSCLSQLDRNTRDLQESVMSIRMMPINFVFSRFPRVVRDLASRLGKQVELKLVGEGTELDRGLIEKIADPLTHLVRNSLDHGIEMPDVRREQGKAEKGVLTLAASHQGGHIVIEVKDDGGGLNRRKILEKARERGMVVSDEISDQDVWQLIFEAGFSTAELVTDVSGRGMGMYSSRTRKTARSPDIE